MTIGFGTRKVTDESIFPGVLGMGWSSGFDHEWKMDWIQPWSGPPGAKLWRTEEGLWLGEVMGLKKT